MIIKNVKVYKSNNIFNKEDIHIKDEYIVSMKEEDDCDIIDGNGYYAIPGLIDIHFHGCNGYDLCDGKYDSIKNMAIYELKNGITAIVPATMTLPMEELLKISKAVGNYKCDEGAELLGVNMEGPFISKEKKGAQDSKYIQCPNIKLFEELQRSANGKYKLVTIAPEERGALEFINTLNSEVTISLGHSKANYNEAMAAIKMGAKHVTHLYNAMTSYSHREPGIIGAACDDKDCMVELICDGIHIHPSVIRNTFKMFGNDRIVLISDSMMATGLKDGVYTLGGQEVKVEGKKATLLKDNTIAGSVSNLMDCMKYAVNECKIPFENVIPCVTENPAKVIGVYDKYGSIDEGKYANIILLDEKLEIKHIIFKGKRI